MKYLINSYLISTQIKDVVSESTSRIHKANLSSLQCIQQTDQEFISFSAEMESKSSELRHYLRNTFYNHPDIVSKNEQGQAIISVLFSYLSSHFDDVPSEFLCLYDSTESQARIVCDYIAGMTDIFAEELFKTVS